MRKIMAKYRERQKERLARLARIERVLKEKYPSAYDEIFGEPSAASKHILGTQKKKSKKKKTRGK